MTNTVQSVTGSSVTLGLHMTDKGSPVSGYAPTVELRRLRDGKYFDFVASSAPYWKTSGGSKEGALSERSWMPGLYTRVWDQALYDGSSVETYAAIYRNPAPYLFEGVEIQAFTFEWAATISYLRKLMENNSIAEVLSESQIEHTWYDDDGVTELLKHKIVESGAYESREKI